MAFTKILLSHLVSTVSTVTDKDFDYRNLFRAWTMIFLLKYRFPVVTRELSG
jgi:hypothetical protein